MDENKPRYNSQEDLERRMKESYSRGDALEFALACIESGVESDDPLLQTGYAEIIQENRKIDYIRDLAEDYEKRKERSQERKKVINFLTEARQFYNVDRKKYAEDIASCLIKHHPKKFGLGGSQDLNRYRNRSGSFKKPGKIGGIFMNVSEYYEAQIRSKDK